jgi:hypothetical protein
MPSINNLHLIRVINCRTNQTHHPVVLLEGAEEVHGDDGEAGQAGARQSRQARVVEGGAEGTSSSRL